MMLKYKTSYNQKESMGSRKSKLARKGPTLNLKEKK